MTQRRQALALYKKIVRVGRNWVAKVESETGKERKYILEESRTLFQKNQNLKEPQEIQQRIEEGEARLQIALHYCRNSKFKKRKLSFKLIINLKKGKNFFGVDWWWSQFWLRYFLKFVWFLNFYSIEIRTRGQFTLPRKVLLGQRRNVRKRWGKNSKKKLVRPICDRIKTKKMNRIVRKVNFTLKANKKISISFVITFLITYQFSYHF